MIDRRFEAEVWIAQNGSWHFVTLPFDLADDIDDGAPDARVGFGSVRVEVTVGGSTWQTSVFPDTKAESYVLPLKQAVRRSESITGGDRITVTLRTAG